MYRPVIRETIAMYLCSTESTFSAMKRFIPVNSGVDMGADNPVFASDDEEPVSRLTVSTSFQAFFGANENDIEDCFTHYPNGI